jgi:vancomycin resistance protein YoaR
VATTIQDQESTRTRRVRPPLPLLVAALVVAATTVALVGLRLAHRGEVLPGITVAGVELGGLDRPAARTALADTVAAREADPVAASFDDRVFTLSPDRVGWVVDVEATVDAAMAPGRGGGVLDETWRHLSAYWTSEGRPLVETYDEEALQAWIGEVATEVDHDPFPGGVSADPDTLEVTAEPPHGGATVDVPATTEALVTALSQPGEDTIELPVDREPARIEAAQVEGVAAAARRALSQPLELTSPPRDVTLQPAELAPLVSLTERGIGEDRWTVELDVTPDDVEALFADRAGDFEVAPVDARFDTPRQPPVTFDDQGDTTWSPRPAEVGIVPSQRGLTFDPDLAAGQLAELMRRGVHQAELRLSEVDPEFSTEDAENLDIDTLLSTFTTYHACCQTRVNNIQRLADLVDGTIVRPGEQFSINQISGERTCSKGFAPAGMILRGEIVDVCGGGVSQFGTTTINAVFFAGLDPDAYKPHSFYISRYPMAREATLNYPSPDIDVKFTNDTGNGILVRTAHTPTSITVSFYGHSDVERVGANVGEPFNVKPYPTEYRENKALPPQTSRTIQSGRNGFSVKLTREVVRADGSTASDDWSNVYVPEREIIERNTDPRPEPKPEPKPSPKDDDEPKPKPSPSSPPPDEPDDGSQ